ncbi:uncharacterized protein F4822DRAFT_433991 [Hypoxylon trugodes]|uniref:uncharacterized protein n=1 Tax=Hypoxylon trugodes TaxID=326681 RepID=UPI00219D9F66|nr:uncharacterized protein F4822DRAFT_433991 [Hypoxylon trugodes]KAI1384042.1 hypothetical protein F4822DRAFT_433991 [Hypoxylon trugodes]
MAKSYKNGNAGNHGALRQQKTRRNVSGASEKSHPDSPDAPSYRINDGPFYRHPAANNGRDDDISVGRRSTQSKHSSEDGTREGTPTPAVPHVETSAGVRMELKLSLSAKLLASQISESKKFWVAFQQKFEDEVTGIKYYASGHTLRQTWRERIEHYRQHRAGEDEDDEEELSIQQMKLEACLDHINNAAEVYARSQPPHSHASHNPRYTALKKIRIIGDVVRGLVAQSSLDSAACADLVKEISNLEKLVDPKSSEAKVIHRVGRQNAKKIIHPDEGEDQILVEPAVLEAGIQVDNDDLEVAEDGDDNWNNHDRGTP